MARDFTPTTDKVTITQTAIINGLTIFSYACWAYIDAFTTTAGQRVGGKTTEWSLNLVDNGINPAKSIQLFETWSGSTPDWYTPTDSLVAGQWYHLAVTHDATSSSNSPNIYINGVNQSLTNPTGASGTYPTVSTGNFIIGNNSSDIRGHDGRIAESGYWNRVLTAVEVSLLASGYSPSFLPNSLVLYCPLWGKDSPELNYINTGVGTVSGTSYGDHPITPIGIGYPHHRSMQGFGR